MRDPRLYAFGIAWLGISLSVYGFDLWLLQITQTMGFSDLAIRFVVAAIFAVGFAAQIISARSSAANNERIWLALPVLLLQWHGSVLVLRRGSLWHF